MYWSDPGYEAVARVIQERAGLVFPAVRQAAVERTIRRAMQRAGIRDATRFADLLWREGTLREEILAELTIGETYFFREPAQFDFLRREVVPGILRRRTAGAPLRIWSAGCASGEEAYSLAILCDQLGALSRARVLGTEISLTRLEKARQGHYGKWSFRGVTAEVIERYFERRGSHFALDPRLQNAVEFQTLNLVEDSYPSPDSGLAEFDLILCRNVLIYFDLETVAAVARRLLASLAEGGWLLLGASDPPLAGLVPCTVVLTGCGVAYRRAGETTTPEPDLRPTSASPQVQPSGPPPPARLASPPEPPRAAAALAASGDRYPAPPRSALNDTPGPAPASEPSRAPISALRAAYASGEYARAAELAAAAVASGCDDEVHSWVLWVRALANQGRLEEAGRVCAGALDRHRLSAELAYLHAVLLLHAGRNAAAATAARRALYLDRDLVVAHLAHAQALGRQGEREAELRALANARRLLAAMPPDALVPASDGATAGYLSERVRLQLHFRAEVH